MNAYIGRQAIYRANCEIAGYELFYRNGQSRNTAAISDGDAATRRVLADAVNVFGVASLTGGLPAFINFTRKLLIEDFAYLVEPGMLAVEVPSDIPMDEALLEKLERLRRDGYKLVLDDYNSAASGMRDGRMLGMFDYVRVNLARLSRMKKLELAHYLESSGAQILAGQVETEQDFKAAVEYGAALFQGYYFDRPACLSKNVPPMADSPLGKLLGELLQVQVDMGRCSEILRSDSFLNHLFFHGSAGGFSWEKRSELDAEGLAHWTGLILLKQGNVNPSDALARRAYLRGLFIERLIENADTPLLSRRGFLMGMFSQLDRVMGVTLNNLLGALELAPEMRDALSGKLENEYSMFLQYAVIYEMGNERLILPEIGLKINDFQISHLYMQCISDTDAAFDGISVS